MRLQSRLFNLPSSILLLLASRTFCEETRQKDQFPVSWPYNLPKHVKYWPEDPPHRRRDLEAIEEHLRLGRKPVGVMKMSTDEGEKFYMEYWQFEGPLNSQTTERSIEAQEQYDEDEQAGLSLNNSAVTPFRQPFNLHTQQSESWDFARKVARNVPQNISPAAVLAVLEKRGFLCPTGTSSCSAIGYPNSCCGLDQTCFSIQDTGLGPVGCCPTGTTCGGVIRNCDAPNTPCAASLGGGCCIPNYVCAGVGCIIDPSLAVTTVITQIFTVTVSSSIRTTTSVLTTTSVSTTTSTTTACTSGFQSCPASLGGGCCSADQACALSSCTAKSTSTISTTSSSRISPSTSGTGVVPVRPTSASTSTQVTETGTFCPTGFYACSAYYAGGCCRTGRNCDTTSCPTTSSTTIISSGVTVVVPVGSAATTTSPTGACATGWSTCAPSEGGNCCPSGFACGTASCSSIGATATEVVQKGSPNLGLKNAYPAVSVVLISAIILLLMIL